MKLILEIFVIVLATVNLLLTWFVLFRLHQPTTVFLWLVKAFVSAIAPLLFLVGLLCAIFGLLLNSVSAILAGSLSAFFYSWYISVVSRPPESSTGFEKVFGAQWKSRIPLERQSQFLSKRYAVRVPGGGPEPVFIRNIPFYTIQGTTRQLLCDIWMPPLKAKQSGLAFIYLHGSAWAVLDKDFGTRAFFRHLAKQGHVIMDVAYRLFPETDFKGMVHDTKHAIAWMKANAADYGIDPGRIVIGGGSAGAHIALLAAYTGNAQLTPAELGNTDLGIQGVISMYGQANLAATYYHTCQNLTVHSALGKKKEGSGGMPSWIQRSMGKDFHRLGFDKDVEPGMLTPMLGGNPDQKPHAYALYSPISFVNRNCPATLLVHGEHDILAPVQEIFKLHSQLTAAGVPVVMHILPQTDHAFDLILLKISPAAHNALYDVERFLGLIASEGKADSRLQGLNELSPFHQQV